ncbi:MAG: hypothetical protein RLZZ67_610 [Candidatus Parcubacteria bacterium]|jgi:hypothetical protein
MKRKLYIAGVVLYALVCLPALVQAAEMYMVLDKANVATDGTFTGTVYVSSVGAPINNAESTLTFPSNLMSVNSVSTAGSIFNIWVEQPTFSNSDGVIYFNGGLPTPGYSGNAGQALKVSFKAKNPGTGDIIFTAPIVRANDGNGTDILTEARGGRIAIGNSEPTPTVSEPIAVGPKAPVITSVDMPLATAWYNKTQATFSWNVPSDVTMARLILSVSTDAAPSINYNPAISSKTLTDLSEGVQYLNVRFKNAVGWGKIASRKIQIDLSDPEDVSVKTSVTADDLIAIDASAKDTMSGIRNYLAYVDGVEIGSKNASADGSAQFNLPPLPEGKYKVVVRAYDLAGNNTQTEVSAEAPAIKTPRITHYPEYIITGSKIEIRGKAPYGEGEIAIWIKQDGKDAQRFVVKPDEDKIFLYTSDTLADSGNVTVWAQTLRTPQIESAASDKIHISVKDSDVVVIGTKALQTISIVITVVLLAFGLITLFYLGIRRFNAAKRKLRRERVHTEQQIHKVFEMLKGDTRRHVKLLEAASMRRKLTKEESKILAELTENLKETEEYLKETVKEPKD